MSDLYLKPTNDGAEIAVVSGKLRTTSALEVAVFLSLFTEQSWADMSQSRRERYISRIPRIMRENNVTNQTRIAVRIAALEALQWMLDDGIADEVDAEAVIRSASRIDLTVTITQPDGTAEFAYAVNWQAQTVELTEAE